MKGFEDVENKTGRLRAAASLSFSLWLMMCMLLPSPAYASDGDGGGHSFGTGDWAYGIVEGPKFIPNREQLATSSWGWIIYAPNKYDAALYVCGMEPSDVSSVTAEQRAKLSNESTGGAFYSLANRIYKVGGGSIPTWANAELIRTLFSAEDTDYVFRLEVDDMQEVNDAKADLQTILDGGNIGGGGGSGGGSNGNSFNGFPLTVNLHKGTKTANLLPDDTSYWFTVNGNKLYPKDVSQINLTINYTGSTIPNGQYDIFCWVYGTNSESVKAYATVYVVPTGTCEYRVVDNRTRLVNVSSSYIQPYYMDTVLTTLSGSGVLTGTVDFNYSSQFIFNAGDSTGEPSNSNRPFYFNDGVSVTPPSQWPDTEPQTPTQPTVPSPTSISITISSQPTFYFEPTITTNTNYTNTTYDGTDYSKQLKSIYDELKAFHVDNNLGLNSVLSNFGQIADGLEALGDDLDQQVNWMVQNLKTDIDTNFSELKDYLKELFEWLADELDFTVSGGGYSDSTVVSWLKKIWSKIGSGVDTRPTDPTVDPFSALDWLLRFISTLIDGLADKASDLSEDLQGLLDNISGKFPFSIPWDVVAILTLFAGEPVAPAIDYDVAIWGDIRFEANIDLSEYDSVMEVVRPMELIAFAAYLLWLTPEVLDSMDVTKGMGSS